MKTHRISRITGALILALGLSTAAMANVTTSAIKGRVAGPSGNPAAGSIITIVHVPSGTTKTATVNEAGLFVAKGLRVGGPYRVVVDSNKFEDTTVKDIYLTLGETYPLSVALNSESALETIVVTGRSISMQSGGTGPAAHFNSDDLKYAPSINRDLKDIVRIDPRIYIDESRSDAIQCGGGNPRFNSLTVDGVRMNDSFGLNDNGYPTTRIPFSYDSIDQVSVELAPFDVKYGGFTSCNINAVTKSGTNEVHGSVFYDYSNDSLKGDSIEGEDQDNGDYDDKRYGFNVGLPLIEDTLFLYTSYEKLDGVQLFEYSPMTGSDPQVTQADIDRVNQISIDKYGYNAGGTPASKAVDDEKILVKLDWNINEDHRASFVYNYNDGFKLDQSDEWGMTLDNHFYESGAELNSFVGSLNSDWTDNFSTEVRVGHTELENRQESLDADSGFGEVQIRHNGTTIFLGPDDSRQSNEMNWETTTFKLAGSYYLDEHTITAGYEYESLTAFNLFMQHTVGEYRFGSIDEYENGLADRVYYNNSAGTNVPSDASQEFTYGLHTFYIQDEYTLPDIDMTLTVGLRYDRYTSSDNPRYNAQFEERYGIRNDKNMDGIDLIQPRVGFNWAVQDNLEVRGGFGLYSGGNPNVWLSNSYSNDGLVNISERAKYHKDSIAMVGEQFDLFNTPSSDPRGPGFGVPQVMVDSIQDLDELSGNASVNATDPNFEIPSEWKYALGATYTTDNDYIVSADILHNRKQDSATILDYNLEYGDKTFDGRPTYKEVTHPDGVKNVSNEYVLTNTKSDGSSTIISLALSKSFDFGLDASFGYSYTKSEDANPMTSAVAGSNYGNLATTDALNPPITTSNYEIPHRFTMNISYGVELIGGLETRFSLFGQASEGQAYSFTYDDSDGAFGDNNWSGDRQLVYIPTVDDANVVYGPDFDKAAFDAFVSAEGLARGQTTGRNAQNADWYVSFDIKINQEIPGLIEGHRGNAFFIIKNVGNMINDDWGVMKQGEFVGNRMVEMSVQDDGKYLYEGFNSGNEDQNFYKDASVWEMRVGVSYDF
ncbi:carboxypeptidase regulatory-like domain-containing protein [Colwellia psychrerythraea]|uniref:Putative OmpA family protein n=1 Tax=Colwellia psychrerythraea (strain 34H / ATCC BAA-681) TaxID=167879 RepID=Q483R8_COLP3|nr:carboxypeptidase regulatory-like domain-containing protein [Colwellia psychrerythraea]AAZ24203.1 putative OmpA family protein [Colwellia psychrerythraea 34H]